MQKHDGWGFHGLRFMHLKAIEFIVSKLCVAGSLMDTQCPSEMAFDLPQGLLVQACGDVLSACVRCLSDIVLKEDGTGRMNEDLAVSSCCS